MQFFPTNQQADRQYVSLLRDINFDPIFILGNHRSGTTLLHNLLAHTGQFNFVTAYHVLRRDEIMFNHINGKEGDAKARLDKLFESLGLSNRIIDETPVGHGMPEEYGSVLGGYAWYRLSPKNLQRFVEFCKKIQFVSSKSRSLVLKNPWDYANFMYMKSAFPKAKFIFIHRHPIPMINSLLKALRLSFYNKNPYVALLFERYKKISNRPLSLMICRLAVSPRFHLGLRLVTWEVFRNTKYFLQNIGSMPHKDYISVRYEDVCEEPDKNMTMVLKWLGVASDVSPDYGGIIKPRPIELLEELEQKQGPILERFSDYLAYCKYDSV